MNLTDNFGMSKMYENQAMFISVSVPEDLARCPS